MECALARVHCQRFARTQVPRGVLARPFRLAVEPEGGGVELNDGRRRPAFHGVEDGFDALIESQQACGEVVRRRYGRCVVAGDVEAARVFHRNILNQRRAGMQKRMALRCARLNLR